METHGNMGKEELRLDFSKPEAFMSRGGEQRETDFSHPVRAGAGPERVGKCG